MSFAARVVRPEYCAKGQEKKGWRLWPTGSPISPARPFLITSRSLPKPCTDEEKPFQPSLDVGWEA